MPERNHKPTGRGIVLDGYLNETEFAAEIGRSVVTLRLWRRKNEGPPFVRVKRTVFYKVEAVRRWLAAQDVQERRQPKAAA